MAFVGSNQSRHFLEGSPKELTLDFVMLPPTCVLCIKQLCVLQIKS